MTTVGKDIREGGAEPLRAGRKRGKQRVFLRGAAGKHGEAVAFAAECKHRLVDGLALLGGRLVKLGECFLCGEQILLRQFRGIHFA